MRLLSAEGYAEGYKMRDVVESSLPLAARPADVSLPHAPPDVTPASAEFQAVSLALASRDRFLGLIGHELRNAIAPMLLLAEQFNAIAGVPGAPPALASR